MKLQYQTETENACDSPINMWKRCKWSRNRTPREACMPALHGHPPRMPESCPKASRNPHQPVFSSSTNGRSFQH